MSQPFPGIPYRPPAYGAATDFRAGGPGAGTPDRAGAGDHGIPDHRAPFLRRVAAMVVDLFVAQFLLSLLGSVAAAARAIEDLGMNPALWEGAQRDATLLSAQMAPLFLFAYFTFFTAYGGRTPGKMLLRLKVLAADGTPAGPWRCVWRTVCYLADLVTWGLGFLLAAGPAGRALHDRIAGTRVVLATREGPTPGAA